MQDAADTVSKPDKLEEQREKIRAQLADKKIFLLVARVQPPHGRPARLRLMRLPRNTRRAPGRPVSIPRPSFAQVEFIARQKREIENT